MRLDDLCQAFHELGFPTAASRQRPPRDHVRAIQQRVEQAIGTDAFLLDCLERDLARLDAGGPLTGLVPFLILPELGIRIAMGYWRPGVAAGVHEHSDWTVTAVCHNALEVKTYDRALAFSERRLAQKHVYAAPAGRAGHIYDPCIHDPWNPTPTWSVSLHIISPHDGLPIVDACCPMFAEDEAALEPGSPPHPFERCARSLQTQRILRVFAELLAQNRDARAPRLLEAVFVRGSAATRRAAAAALASCDPAAAPAIFAALARHALGARTRVRTRTVAPELEVRVGASGAAELLATTARGRTALLRCDARAVPALETLARERELVVGELPGDLDDGERAALVDALQDWGLFANEEPVSARQIPPLFASHEAVS